MDPNLDKTIQSIQHEKDSVILERENENDMV